MIEMKGKPPSFQFYPDSWLSSQDIMLMTPAQEGAYIRLLSIAWLSEDCGLPDDDEALARLSRLGEEWFKGGYNLVKTKFQPKGNRLYNLRLLEERKKQEQWREKSVEGGKKSAKSRWGHKKRINKGGYQMVTECLQPNCNPSSPSSLKELPPISPAQKASCSPEKGVSDVLFQEFWKAYPKKIGKPKAESAFMRETKKAGVADLILADVKRRLASDEQWLRDGGQFIPHPTTYLNNHRWEDQVDTVEADPCRLIRLKYNEDGTLKDKTETDIPF
jgi:uncharacterized protein YdaU (DUF1376 family)